MVTSMNYPRIVEVKEIVEEAYDVKSIFFSQRGLKKPKAGQFFMIWIPGIDEVPMSVSFIGENELGITVKKVGEATAALHSLSVGDKIGVRGPFGNGFTLSDGDVLIVGGGIGIAPLYPLIMDLLNTTDSITVVLAAKNNKMLIFLDKISNILRRECDSLVVVTDDGSAGLRGLASDIAAKLIEEKSYDHIYMCGPEIMMRKIFDKAEEKGVEVQACLERYMKCGIGLCGSCCIGEYLVCKDGPVFNSEILRKLKDEFGVFKRDSSGLPIEFSS